MGCSLHVISNTDSHHEFCGPSHRVVLITFLLYIYICIYTAYAGWAFRARIPVKFGTAHGRWRLEGGSAKCIEAYGRNGVNPAPRIFGTSDEKMMTPTLFLGPKHNFYSLTVCRLDQYLPNGSENTALLP